MSNCIRSNNGGVSLLSQTALDWSCLVIHHLFDLLRICQCRTWSVRPLWLCSDQNMWRNWIACHTHLFTVFAWLNAEWEFYKKACIRSVIFRFSNVYKIVCDMKAFCNPHLVKSVNLVFMHMLFHSVYNDDAASNIKVNRPGNTNLVQVISSWSWTGLILSGKKRSCAGSNDAASKCCIIWSCVAAFFLQTGLIQYTVMGSFQETVPIKNCREPRLTPMHQISPL